jgi:hypothetical protein
LAGALVFFMQAGFAMLEVGIVQPKNATNILFKNLIDASLAAITWWLVGYGVAFGTDNGNHFIGTDNYAIDRESLCPAPVAGPSRSAACHYCRSQLISNSQCWNALVVGQLLCVRSISHLFALRACACHRVPTCDGLPRCHRWIMRTVAHKLVV